MALVYAAFFFACVLGGIYSIAVMIWVEHVRSLSIKKLFEPWRRALRDGDWKSCAHFREASAQARALYFVRNPVAWVRNWNWEPTAKEKREPC